MPKLTLRSSAKPLLSEQTYRERVVYKIDSVDDSSQTKVLLPKLSSIKQKTIEIKNIKI